MVRAMVTRRGRRPLVAALALVVGVVGSVTLASNLSAQGGSQSCGGDYVVNAFGAEFGNQNARIYSNTNLPGWTTQRSFAASLPAGTFSLTGVSYDGYVGREAQPQPNEQWSAEFWGGGSLLGASNITGDVPDGVQEAFWSGGIGTVTLAAPADTVVFKHGFLTNSVPNSVAPICVGLLDQTPPPPDTTTSTTTTSTTTTTAPPPGTEPPPGTNPPTPTPTPTPPPPTPAPPPAPPTPPPAAGPAVADQPDTEVLGAVEQAGVATAVQEDPTFTG